MANVDLSQYGITGVSEIVYNPSYDTLFEEETKQDLTGYDVGQVSELGAVNGQSPNEHFKYRAVISVILKSDPYPQKQNRRKSYKQIF